MLCEMQSVSSRDLNSCRRVPFSYDDNHYTMGTIFFLEKRLHFVTHLLKVLMKGTNIIKLLKTIFKTFGMDILSL